MIALTRRELVELTGNNPYVAMMAGGAEAAIYRRGDAYVWVAEGPWGPVIVSLGESGDVLPMLAELRAAGSLGRTSWTHLPRTPAEAIGGHVTAVVQEHWDFLWTSDAPPHVPGEDRVVRLGDVDAPAIEDVLDDALPASSTRPGESRIRAWYGIWEGERLVAVAADRSRGETGFLAGIAVRRDHQGQGLGAAVTAAVTRLLLKEYAAVALGVTWNNDAAQRLYERLGYTNRIERTSVRLS